jgi:hypothetical protein
MDEMNPDEIIAYLEEANPDALLADGLEKAIIGVVRKPCQGEVALYHEAKCIEILMEDFNLDYTGAVEYFEFNVVGAYVGTNTPVFLTVSTDTTA